MNEIGHELTIIECEAWAHGGPLHPSLLHMLEIFQIKNSLKHKTLQIFYWYITEVNDQRQYLKVCKKTNWR